MNLVKVEGHAELRKDKSSGGVVNVDRKSYAEYQKAKKIAEKKVRQQENAFNKIEVLENDINSIKSEMGDIKQLLTTLIEKM
jgi:hypothetical protein